MKVEERINICGKPFIQKVIFGSTNNLSSFVHRVFAYKTGVVMVLNYSCNICQSVGKDRDTETRAITKAFCSSQLTTRERAFNSQLEIFHFSIFEIFYFIKILLLPGLDQFLLLVTLVIDQRLCFHADPDQRIH